MDEIRINESIKSRELRVLGAEGENLGVIDTSEALKHAQKAGLDLVEVSAKAKPPVARIVDFGKYKYELKKKEKEIKSRATVTETKVTQVKIGTGEGDLKRKANKVGEWLSTGNRVKVDLFLWGRYKYMEFEFLKERLERFLAIVPESFKIADEIKKSPKGLSVTLEPGKGEPKAKKEHENK